MSKSNQNRPRRREPYHYDATGAVYIACIEAVLQRGQSIPLNVLQLCLSYAAAVYAQLNRLPHSTTGGTDEY